jgi:hypothetical protein
MPLTIRKNPLGRNFPAPFATGGRLWYSAGVGTGLDAGAVPAHQQAL